MSEGVLTRPAVCSVGCHTLSLSLSLSLSLPLSLLHAACTAPGEGDGQVDRRRERGERRAAPLDARDAHADARRSQPCRGG